MYSCSVCVCAQLREREGERNDFVDPQVCPVHGVEFLPLFTCVCTYSVKHPPYILCLCLLFVEKGV